MKPQSRVFGCIRLPTHSFRRSLNGGSGGSRAVKIGLIFLFDHTLKPLDATHAICRLSSHHGPLGSVAVRAAAGSAAPIQSCSGAACGRNRIVFDRHRLFLRRPAFSGGASLVSHCGEFGRSGTAFPLIGDERNISVPSAFGAVSFSVCISLSATP